MINIKGLNISYNDKTVLKDINCSFSDSSLTVILGPNGSGKTTLIKSAIGLIDKNYGKIEIDGKQLDEMSLKERARKVSYLSQNRNVPCITTERMVLHGRFPYMSWPRRYTKKDWDIVYASMEKTDCLSLKGRMISELSGGEKQKVYLAMSLAQDTKSIFMDEPTTYLDIAHQLSLMNMVKELTKKGKSVIMVLHDLGLALQFADNILVLKDGKVIKEDTRDNIYNSNILNDVFNVKICKSSNHFYIESKEDN